MSRRALGWGLIVYGLIGVVLIAGGASTGLALASTVERLAVTADGTLQAAVRSTEAAADAFINVDGSLEEAESSASSAADLAVEASGTLQSLAFAMEISIFGAQPLLPLAAEFDASAQQAAALGDELDGVGGSLGNTRVDVARIGTELDGLSRELGALRDASGNGVAAPPIRLFVTLLLLWLLVPALGGLVAGVVLLRTARTL